jgi:hypothetical protein
VKEYHKSIKQNASIGSSPARSAKAQSDHLFASIFAFVKLEKIKLEKNLNHFAIKAKLYTAAIKVAFSELNALKENLTGCMTNCTILLKLYLCADNKPHTFHHGQSINQSLNVIGHISRIGFMAGQSKYHQRWLSI